jgi:hypothetical protein
MMGVGGNPLCISYDRINSVASIPPMNGIDTSIYDEKCISLGIAERTTKKTNQDDIERLILRHPRLERIHRQTSILRNLNDMAILLEDLHSELLVDEVVLGEQDVERDVVGRRDGADGIGLERRDE